MDDIGKLRKGTKIQVAYDVPIGREPLFNMICTFNKALDSSAFLISAPMNGSRLMQPDESQKLLLRFEEHGQTTLIVGYADDVVKDGIRSYWKIRRTEQRQMFKRADERIKVALHLQYLQDTWPPNSDGEVEKEDALSLDISNGGVAMYLPRRFDVGEICQTTMPRIGSSPNGKSIENIIGIVCWCREAPKGSPYRYLCGLQFRFGSTAEKETLIDYVANVKKRYSL